MGGTYHHTAMDEENSRDGGGGVCVCECALVCENACVYKCVCVCESELLFACILNVNFECVL